MRPEPRHASQATSSWDTNRLRQQLAEGASALGCGMTAAQQDRLLAYLALLHRWTKVYNLTAVRAPDDMLTHHLLDSLAVVNPMRRFLDTHEAPRVLDVGSGGGLPGVVLATMCPTVDVTCVDTVGKKAAFIRQCAGELQLPNLHAVHARVESMPTQPGFDVVTARAFSSLAQLEALTHTLLRPGGVWAALKGQRPAEEIAALPSQAEVFHVEQLQVPGLAAERCLVWIRPATPPN